MKSFDTSDLINSIENINNKLKNNGSPFRFQYNSFCNYVSVDLYNSGLCVRNIDCNKTPEQLYKSTLSESLPYLEKNHPNG